MMQDCFYIKKVAVLGAGVMGAQIAALCVNAGIPTFLYDLKAKEGEANSLVTRALAHLNQLKPKPLGLPENALLIEAKNYEEDLEDLSACDLIIEAIAERIDWKEALYHRIAPYLRKDSYLVSNTSGLSINTLAEALPPFLRAQFCGLHFFNPPRYMHLVELIPASHTAPALVDKLETWLTSYLGKGVVRAKDRPNFIANRIGVFSLLSILHHAQGMNLKLDEVDALTGPLLGRPKSASFRTMDVVGLDTLKHVVDTMQEHLKEDPWHDWFYLPDWMQVLIQKGHLGQKSGQGIYRKQGTGIEVYDVQTETYRPIEVQVSEEIQNIMKNPDQAAGMQELFASMHPQAKFLAACFRDLFHYSAYHLEEIADTVRDLDQALCWGFGWREGPFETWQAAGLQSILEAIRQQSDIPMPDWPYKIETFYTQAGAYSPARAAYQARNHLPVYHRQNIQAGSLLYENEGLALSHLKEDVALLRFKTKANTIGQSILDGLGVVLDKVEQSCQGLIIYQDDASNFCSGADLRMVLSSQLETVALMIKNFQDLMMRIKYSPVPIVAALRGRALGGGCELLMHCSSVIAAYESYPGLVEIGAGLLPAGGGCKEMALRASSYTDLMTALQTYFQQIATARVANSASEALDLGYLRTTDTIIMHTEEVLFAALTRIKALQAFNYHPPLARPFKIVGIEGQAKIQAGLVNYLEGGFITPHDYYLATEISKVLSGGDLNEGTLVTEEWLLKLEREAFVLLASNPLSQARMRHLLTAGKPLSN